MTAREKNVFTILQNELNPSDSSDDEDITAAFSEDEYVPSDDTDSEDDFVEEDFEPIVREEEEVEPEDEALGGEQCASSSQDFYTAKDGTIWQSTPSQRRRTQQHNIMRCRAGPKNMPDTLTEVIQAFRLYLSDKVLDLIVKHTNAEATRIYKEKRPQSTWNPTNRTEILAYIGLVMAAGHLKQRHLCVEKMWHKKYGSPIFRATMPEYRFYALSRFIRFDDKSTRTARRAEDKLAPIREIFDEINKLLLRYYTPHEYLTVDEQLVPFRGCCPFKQYLSSKPDKYGMKIFWVCDAKTFYPLKTKPYLGKQGNAPQRGLAKNLVLELSAPFHNTRRNITMDNYFTDMALAVNLLQNGLTLVGTVRKNKTFLPPSFLPSRRREVHSSNFGFMRNMTLMSYVPKINKAVLILSTMHDDAQVTDDDIKKPEINLFYNETKGGVDSLDQLVHSYMTKRKNRRWPLCFFHNLLDVAGVAAFILWTSKNPNWEGRKLHKRRLFLELLSDQLVEGEIQQIAKGGLRQSAKHALLLIECPLKENREAGLPTTSTQSRALKRKRCHICSRGNDRKTPHVCNECNQNVCTAHSVSVKTTVCNDCQ